MNGKAWTANPWLAGVLLLVLGAPCAVARAADAPEADAPAAEAGDKEAPEMSPEAKLLGHLEHIEAPADGWFTKNPTRYDGPYDAQEQLDIYGKKYLNRTARAPIELGR